MEFISFIVFIVILILFIRNRKAKQAEEFQRQEDEQRRIQAEEQRRRQEFEERQRQIMEERQREEDAYQRALNDAKYEYSEALKGKDTSDALQKGKIYYALMRFGIDALTDDYTTELSRRDEDRISLDIQAMNC